MDINQQIEMLESKIDLIKLDIEDKQGEIATAQSNLETFEYSCTEEEYDEYLDNVFDEVEVYGMTYAVSYALKELDPTAYRCAKLDYESDFELENCEEYRDMLDKLEELEAELESLEDGLEDIQNELNVLESED